MADLYVDLSSMNGFYNQLGQASGDAEDALRHVHAHRDLAPHEAGFLGQLLTPHRTAYGQLAEVLARLHDLTREAGIRVNPGPGGICEHRSRCGCRDRQVVSRR